MRKQTRRPVVVLLTAASLAIVCGCESTSPPSVDTGKTEATVKGIVKVGGAPATEGEIIFDPTNHLRKDVTPRSAPIGKDGSYTIKTLTGNNTVKLSGAIVKKNPIAGRVNQAFDVSSGENTFNPDFAGK